MKQMDLRRKQDYYSYAGGWSFKQPPKLDDELHRRVAEIDPNFRLIWGGVAVVRNEPDGFPAAVRGPREATKTLHGRLTARYVDARVKQFHGFTFKLKNGREKTVLREDSIPRSKRAIAVAKFEYVDYGRLYWFLERYLTTEQLIEAQYYFKDDPNLPRPGDYIYRLHVCTPEGLYWEPDHDWLDMVASSTFETLTTPLKDLYFKDKTAREESEAARQAAEAKQTCIDPEEVLRMTIDQTKPRNPKHFLPPPPHLRGRP